MSKRNNYIFKGLQIVAWIIFVGLCIEAGGLLVNLVYAIFKPEVIAHLYQKLDLTAVYNSSHLAFFGLYGSIISISLLKAYLFYFVIRMLSKLDLEKPFNQYVADQITKISYFTFSIGIISHVTRQAAKSIRVTGFELETLNNFWADSQAYILMSAVIYVIATIFKRGVEIQNENELTV